MIEKTHRERKSMTKTIKDFFERVPSLDFSYIEILTKPTGIIQHAKFNIPDYHHGYCLDDNCRSLLLYCKAFNHLEPKYRNKYISIYLSFIQYAQKSDGNFRNFMSFDHNFLERIGSDDSFGRTIWALGYLLSREEITNFHAIAKEIFDRAYPHMENCKSVRAVAYQILGLIHYLEKFPENEKIQKQLDNSCQFLMNEYHAAQDDNWHWFEEVISYDNAILPLSLLRASQFLGNKELENVALRSSCYLDQVVFQKGYFSSIGNMNWLKKDGSLSDYGQQPIEVSSTIMLYDELNRHDTGINCQERILQAFSWFLGINMTGDALFDFQNMACFDGLEDYGVNKNQGAESNLSFWLSYLDTINYTQFS